MMKKFVSLIWRLFAVVASLLLSAWSGAKAMLDYLGRIGAAQDLDDPKGIAASALHGFFTTPWWMPGMLAAGLAAFLAVMAFRSMPTLAERRGLRVVNRYNQPDKPLVGFIYSFENKTAIHCQLQNMRGEKQLLLVVRFLLGKDGTLGKKKDLYSQKYGDMKEVKSDGIWIDLPYGFDPKKPVDLSLTARNARKKTEILWW